MEFPFSQPVDHFHRQLPDSPHLMPSHFLLQFPARKFHVHCNLKMEQDACPGFLQVQAPHRSALSYIQFLSHIPEVDFPVCSDPINVKFCCSHLHFGNQGENNPLLNPQLLSGFLFPSVHSCRSALCGCSLLPLPETIQNTSVWVSP